MGTVNQRSDGAVRRASFKSAVVGNNTGGKGESRIMGSANSQQHCFAVCLSPLRQTGVTSYKSLKSKCEFWSRPTIVKYISRECVWGPALRCMLPHRDESTPQLARRKKFRDEKFCSQWHQVNLHFEMEGSVELTESLRFEN